MNYFVAEVVEESQVNKEEPKPSPEASGNSFKPDGSEADSGTHQQKYATRTKRINEVILRRKRSEDIVDAPTGDFDDIYSMTSEKKGNAFILVIENFKDPRKKRMGATEDAKLTAELFTKFGYEVFTGKPLKDLKETDIISKINEFKEQDWTNVDSCVVAISSHGLEKGFYSSDEIIIDLDKLIIDFNDKSFNTCVGKPKLFFIAACRGDEMDYIDHADYISESTKKPFETYIPSTTDIAIFYAAQPGYKSFRNQYGTFFFNTIVDVFMNNAYKDELHELLIKATSRLCHLRATIEKEDEKKRKKIVTAKQTTEIVYKGWQKKFYFNV